MVRIEMDLMGWWNVYPYISKKAKLPEYFEISILPTPYNLGFICKFIDIVLESTKWTGQFEVEFAPR